MVIVLLGMVIGITGLYGIKTIAGASVGMYQNVVVPASNLLTITESFQRVRINLHEYLEANTNSSRRSAITR